jgi:energy-coupling factor transporter transmembrane protein EcfT
MVIIAWKEIVLFGFIMSYAIFTVSRTAYLAIIVSTLLVICVAISYYKKQFLRIIGMFVLSVVLCFPAAFTLQRIIPTIVADPVFYLIDDTDEFVRGGADWDNTNFMCVERFANLFEDKILGMDVGTYEYPNDANNYELGGKGDPVYDQYGFPYEDSFENPDSENYEPDKYGYNDIEDASDLLAAAFFTRAERTMLLEEMVDYVDYDNALDVISNGRITIFKSYISELNLWGHEDMGAVLPNGEIALHAHNTFLQVAYDHGIVGGVLFAITMISALVASLIYFKNNRTKEMLSLVTCAVIIGFAVAGLTEWVFHYCNPMTIALMLSLAPLTFKAQGNE